MSHHLLYVGTELPAPGFGSSVVIYRHLSRLRGWRVTVMSFELGSGPELPQAWQVVPLRQPRWWPPLHSLVPASLHLRLWLLRKSCEARLAGERPSAILTVLGRNSIFAWHLARRWGIPLSVIVHDRWEVWATARMDRRFMPRLATRILNDAARVWTVTSELGSFYPIERREKVRVLLPLPEGGTGEAAGWAGACGRRTTVVFAGSFRPYQRRLLVEVARALARVQLTLVVITQRNDLLQAALHDVGNICFRQPFRVNADLLRFLVDHAAAALVLLSPKPEDDGCAFERTSFPSKLVDFAHTGLPLLMLAPAESAPAIWARARGWLGFVEWEHEDAVAALVERLTERETWEAMATQSRAVAEAEFDPQRIHQQFEQELVKDCCLGGDRREQSGQRPS